MSRFLPPSTAAAAVLAGALFLSATGGAVAGSMITGKQVKDSSLTGKDVKDQSLEAGDLTADATLALTGPKGPAGPAGAPGVTGLQTVTVTSDTVSPGTSVSLTAICPAGKKVLGGSAAWDNGYPGVTYPLLADRWNVVGKNPGANNGSLSGYVICGVVS